MKTLAQLNQYSTSSVVFTDQTLGAGQVLANRYQINGLLDTSKPVLENIEKICSAAGSWLSYDNHEGRWGVVINQTGTSVASFSDSNIIGNISLGGTGLQDLYNSVKVEFPHRELRDSADFVQIEIPSGDRNANESDNTLNLSYDILNEPVQADLLGFIELKQSRVDLVIKFTTDFGYIGLKAGDVIDVTDSRFGFTNKLFRIITIAEIQEDNGALMMEITAVEYDDTVYSTADLYRYTRSDSNGIITIGSIGVPGTPQVSKFEVDARPRVIVESTAPTGVVEGMEFWLTNDVSEIQDQNRSYTLIATKRPVGGGTYNSGDNVVLDYDQLNTSNFYVKTRGFNATTVGPYSDPSGYVSFTATQVTDAIGPNTKALDALGAIGTLLGVYSLLKGVDELYQKVANTSSLFTKIFETLKDQTGIDLTSPSPNIGERITVRDEGTTLSTSATVFNFVGDGVIATSPSTGTIVVQIGQLSLPSISGIEPNSGPVEGGTNVTISGTNFGGADRVTFNGITATNLEVVSSSTIRATTPANSAGPASVVVRTPNGSNAGALAFTYLTATEYISMIAKLPPDRATGYDPVNNASSDTAPIKGSYYAKFGGRTFYGPLTAGSGSAKLYKSDGTLVETLDASQLVITNNMVEFPFAERELGTDYYILMDQGLVQYCGYPSIVVSSPDGWNFNTPKYESDIYNPSADSPSAIPSPTVSTISPSGTNICPNADLVVTYNREVGLGSGDIKIHKSSDDSIAATISGGAGVVNGNTINYGSLAGKVDGNTAYYFVFDSGVALGKGDCNLGLSSPSAAIAKANNKTFTTLPIFVYTSFDVESLPLTDTSNTKVNPQTNITLNFNRTPYLGTGTISVYKADGTLHQAINTDTSFTKDQTNELIWVTGNSVVVNPTTDLDLATTYYVLMTEGSVTDSCRSSFPSITSNTTVRFTTDPGPSSTPETLTTASNGLSMDFDRDIQPGEGSLKIYDANNNLVKTVSSTDPSVNYEE